MDPVVTVDQLSTCRSALVADVRWYLDGRSGHDAYVARHLPGAVFVDLDRDLADHAQPVTAGRHPFPTPAAFAAAMSRLGIGDDVPVIAYDDSGGGTAGRLVWMLRILGHDAALLDGGLAAWTGATEHGPGQAREASAFTRRPWPIERFVTADEVGVLAAGAAAGGAPATAPSPVAAATTPSSGGAATVLDARSAERFRGEAAAIDPRPGHIPGARSAPWATNLDPESGRYLPADRLTEHYAARGARRDGTVVCYCGSGVSACANLLGLERAGFTDTRLYVASWSGWASDPDRMVATGV